MAHYRIDLACGELELRTVREVQPLPELLGFATRKNPRRGFLFVSRVLGKHIPCAPAVMRDTYDRLADELGEADGPLLVVGLAETATGLGGGIADTLARRGRDDLLFQHTTRHWLDAPVLLRFDEAHSHAPDHILYAPAADLAARYRATRTLVLVDDEITTGRTLARLAAALAAHLPELTGIGFVSLVNWLDPGARARLAADLPVPLRFVSLIDGTFDFRPRPGFVPTPPPGTSARQAPAQPARADLGRRGWAMAGCRHSWMDAAAALADRLATRGHRSVSVIGTGELAFPPFRLAEELARLGLDVLFQGTTRSPILAGGAIAASLHFLDEHGEGVQNYLHNPPSDGRRPILAYESAAQAAAHPLPRQLDALLWIPPDLAEPG